MTTPDKTGAQPEALHGGLPPETGGVATLLRQLKPLLNLDALTVTGRTLGEELERAGPGFPQDVVRSMDRPIYPQGGIAVLRAAVGGPLAQVRNGDRIRLSVRNREISLLVSEEELARRMRDNAVVEPIAERGYLKLFLQTVTQADQGVDFDFLRAARSVGKTPRG